MADYDVWDIIEAVRSMPIRDQKEVMGGLISAWNNNHELHAHAHNLLKPTGGRRRQRRNLATIASEIEPHLKKHGFITWKTANKRHSLGKAEAFARVMVHIPTATRSTKLHKEGGRNWYYLSDLDPTKWIASHEEGPIDPIDNPTEATEALLGLINRKYSDLSRINTHRILTKEKAVFKLPNKFNSQYRDWADQYLTPIMESAGYIANQTRKVYRKNKEE